MPRNRMIKVDFWADEKIGKLSMPARLLYIGIWNFCDDSGACRAIPSFLRSNIFPFDDITLKEVESWLKELSDNGRVSLIEKNNESYLQVPNFLKHQVINKPSSYRFIEDSRSSVVVVTEESRPKEKENLKEKVKENLNFKEKENFNVKENNNQNTNNNSVSISAQLRDCASLNEPNTSLISGKKVPKEISLNDDRKKVKVAISEDGNILINRPQSYSLIDDLHAIFWFNTKDDINEDIKILAREAGEKLKSGTLNKNGKPDQFGWYYFFNKMRVNYLKIFPNEYFE